MPRRFSGSREHGTLAHMLLSLALSMLLSADAQPVKEPEGDHHHTMLQSRGRRIRGTCHGQGTKCDTGHCCPGLQCVDEVQGKMCRKPEKSDDDK